MAIKSLRLFSVAKVFAFYYSLWGLVTGMVFAFTAKERWEAPLGFFVPFLSAKLDFVFKRSQGALGLLAQIVLITLAYALRMDVGASRRNSLQSDFKVFRVPAGRQLGD